LVEEDYGIHVNYKNSDKREWLEDTKKLSIYKDLKDQVTLHFKMKPKLFTIKFKDDTSDTVLVDKDEPIQHLIATLAQRAGLRPK